MKRSHDSTRGALVALCTCALLAATAAGARADCSIEEIVFHGKPAYALQNDFIRAVVSPPYSGRLVELEDRAWGGNLMAPFEVRSSMKLAGAFTLTLSNMAGTNDWVKPEGLRNNEIPCEATVKTRTPEAVELELRFETDDYAMVRTVGIRKGSRILDYRVELIGKGEDKTPLRYWLNTLIAPGGAYDPANDRVFVPAKKRETSAMASTVRSTGDKDQDVEEGAVTKSGVCFSAALIQPWRAILDLDKGVGLGQLLDMAQLGEKNATYFCSNPGTIEVIYPPAPLADGERATYEIAFAPLHTLRRVDYMSRDMALSVLGDKTLTVGADDDTVSMAIRVLPLRRLDSATLVFSVRNRESNKIQTFRKKELDNTAPNCAILFDVTRKRSELGLAPGAYDLMVSVKTREGASAPEPILSRTVIVE